MPIKREAQIEPVQCPVCRVLLGKRYPTEIYISHCSECKTTFTWKPWIEKPSAIMDKDIPEKCNCNSCRG